MKPWRVLFAPDAAEATRQLPPDVKRSVRGALDALVIDPRVGKELVRELRGLWSFRARRYRIVYGLETSSRTIRVLAVAYRISVYEELARQRTRGSE